MGSTVLLVILFGAVMGVVFYILSIRNDLKKASNAPSNATMAKWAEDNTIIGSRVNAGRFEIYKDERKEYRFRFLAANNEIVATSEGYKSKQACKKGVRVLQELVGSAKVEDT